MTLLAAQASLLTNHAVWYFFNDVYPPLHNGHKPLDPPAWWIRLFEGPPIATPIEATEWEVQPVDVAQDQEDIPHDGLRRRGSPNPAEDL